MATKPKVLIIDCSGQLAKVSGWLKKARIPHVMVSNGCGGMATTVVGLNCFRKHKHSLSLVILHPSLCGYCTFFIKWAVKKRIRVVVMSSTPNLGYGPHFFDPMDRWNVSEVSGPLIKEVRKIIGQ